MSLSNPAVNAAADAVTVLCNSGYLRIYAGTKATTADTALSGQTLLAELRFAATAFGAAVAGVATANAIVPDAAADAGGVATWFRTLKSDGSTVVFDGTCGTGGTDLVLNTATIGAGAPVSITSFLYTNPR